MRNKTNKCFKQHGCSHNNKLTINMTSKLKTQHHTFAIQILNCIKFTNETTSPMEMCVHEKTFFWWNRKTDAQWPRNAPAQGRQARGARSIIMDMALIQDHSLIHKLGLSWPSSKSDSSILSTWQKKTAFAHIVLLWSGPAFSLCSLLLFELSCFKVAGRALWVIVQPPLRVSAAKWLLRRPFGLVYCL